MAQHHESSFYLAHVEVGYSRKLVASGDPIFFRAPAGTAAQGYQLTGFSAARQVYAISSFASVAHLTGGSGSFFGDNVTSGRAYLVLEPDSLLHPLRLERAPYAASTAYLHDTSRGADDIIVAWDGFRTYADELADWRRGHLQGFASPRVAVAGTQQVYDEFTGGRFDPTAIRNFTRFAFRHWQGPALSFLTLLGDCSSDFKNDQHLAVQGGITNYVPMYENGYDASLPGHEQYGTDDWYTDVSDLRDRGNLMFAVGRLPAANTEQARLLVHDKTIAYEKNPELGTWRNRIVEGADDAFLCNQTDGIGLVHTQQAEDQVLNYVPEPIDKRKVYLVEYGYGVSGDLCNKPGAERDYVEGMNQGALVVTYIGHGNPTQIANEKMFSTVDLGSLHNGRRLWWFLMASCTVGKVDSPIQDGLAESVMKLTNGGAVVALAATDEAYSDESVPLDNTILGRLFDKSDGSLGHAVGVAVLYGKLVRQNFLTNNSKYVLQGDPALTIAAAAHEIRAAVPDTIRRGQLVEIPITVYRGFGSNEALTSFSGIDSVEVMEPPTVRDLFKLRRSLPDTTVTIGFGLPEEYELPSGTIFRGVGTIQNGTGTIRFFVPATARLGPKTRIRVYAQSASQGGGAVDAAGSGLMVTGSAPLDSIEEAPVITATLDGDPSDVKPGAFLHITARAPHGIYLGQQATNSVLLTIDDGRRVVLNSLFNYKPDSASVGTVDYLLPPLERGTHTAVISAASNYATPLDKGSHRSTATVQFGVGGGAASEIQNVFNYPNPVREGETDLYFDFKDPGRATVTIYTVAGSRLRTLSSDISGGRTRLHWDLRDEAGDGVPNGTYLFQVDARNGLGKESRAIGRIVVLRK